MSVMSWHSAADDVGGECDSAGGDSTLKRLFDPMAVKKHRMYIQNKGNAETSSVKFFVPQPNYFCGAYIFIQII